MAVFLDFKAAIERYGHTQAVKSGIHSPTAAQLKEFGKQVVQEKYGNLFEMYETLGK